MIRVSGVRITPAGVSGSAVPCGAELHPIVVCQNRGEQITAAHAEYEEG